MYDTIVDESVFIARASEGAITTEWVMSQPIHIRKKYSKMFDKELKERERRLKQKQGRK